MYNITYWLLKLSNIHTHVHILAGQALHVDPKTADVLLYQLDTVRQKTISAICNKHDNSSMNNGKPKPRQPRTV